jgi:hypothetical protein
MRNQHSRMLPVSVDATREQVIPGDRIFHGEAANGTCYQKLIRGDSLAMIKKTIRNNVALAPGRDGDLTDSDLDAVAAYVWSLVHQQRLQSQSAAR